MPNIIGTEPDSSEFYERVWAGAARHERAFGQPAADYEFQEYPKAVKKPGNPEEIHTVVASKEDEEKFFAAPLPEPVPVVHAAVEPVPVVIVHEGQPIHPEEHA